MENYLNLVFFCEYYLNLVNQLSLFCFINPFLSCLSKNKLNSDRRSSLRHRFHEGRKKQYTANLVYTTEACFNMQVLLNLSNGTVELRLL